MIIDRTPMSDQSHDRLCIQHVPAHIYKASYPCWIFSHQGLLRSALEPLARRRRLPRARRPPRTLTTASRSSSAD